MEVKIFLYEGGLCQVVVPIFESVGYLDSFGLLKGHALAPVMF